MQELKIRNSVNCKMNESLYRKCPQASSKVNFKSEKGA